MEATVTTARYTLREEVANSITHGIGFVLAVAGLAVLASWAAVRGDVWHVVSCSIFGGSLVLLYTASTLYHSIQLPKAKSILRIIDHASIFILIAGPYTPFTLVSLRGPWGWSLFGSVWGLAIIGIIFQVYLIEKAKILSLVLYAVMGWGMLVAIKPLVASVAFGGIVLLVSGGVAYTAGIAFYVWRRLPYHHAIWHVFVLMGSTLHFFAILFFVIPQPLPVA